MHTYTYNVIKVPTTVCGKEHFINVSYVTLPFLFGRLLGKVKLGK